MPDNKLQNNNLKVEVVGIPGCWSSEKLADAVIVQTGSPILIEWRRLMFACQLVRFDLGRLFLHNKNIVLTLK